MKNIPSILNGNEFSRAELYPFYILFEALSVCTALSNRDNHSIDGIDF